MKCNDFERCVWARAQELEQSRPSRIGTAQLVLAIASANVPVFHNSENIAGVDRLAIGMIGMARHGSDQVSPESIANFPSACVLPSHMRQRHCSVHS